MICTKKVCSVFPVCFRFVPSIVLGGGVGWGWGWVLVTPHNLKVIKSPERISNTSSFLEMILTFFSDYNVLIFELNFCERPKFVLIARYFKFLSFLLPFGIFILQQNAGKNEENV